MSARLAFAAACAIACCCDPNITLAAQATSPLPPNIFIDLTITYNSSQPLPPPILPGDKLSGIALFFNQTFAPDQTPINQIEAVDSITPLAFGHSVNAHLTPTDPCFATTACTFNFTFGGNTGNFPTLAFGPNDIVPTDGSIPLPPPIRIDLSSLLQPSPPPIKMSGPLIAFDAPVPVGQWDLDIGVASVPGPAVGAGLPGLLAGFGAMLAWYRRRVR